MVVCRGAGEAGSVGVWCVGNMEPLVCVTHNSGNAQVPLCFGGAKLDTNFSNSRVELEEASLRQRKGRKNAVENGRGHFTREHRAPLPWLCYPQFPEQQGLP